MYLAPPNKTAPLSCTVSAALTDTLDPTFRTRTTADWLGRLNGLLPAAPVYRLDQALDSGFARDALMAKRFGFSEIQANHILDMPLRRLTKLAKTELQDEHKKLLEEISFNAEDRKGSALTIDAAYVNGQLSEIARNTDLSKYVL